MPSLALGARKARLIAIACTVTSSVARFKLLMTAVVCYDSDCEEFQNDLEVVDIRG